MKPGSVVVDVCIDQGGCFETSEPTTHAKPTYVVDDVVHYCVANMPGAVGRTSTFALCNVTFPYLRRIVSQGLAAACGADPGLAEAVNCHAGEITHRPGGGGRSACRTRSWHCSSVAHAGRIRRVTAPRNLGVLRVVRAVIPRRPAHAGRLRQVERPAGNLPRIPAPIRRRRTLHWPVTLSVALLALIVALMVGWIVILSRTALWTALTVGIVLFALVLVGIAAYLILSIKAVRLHARQVNFVDSVTHELKTPLAAAKLYLETLQLRPDMPEEKREDCLNVMAGELDRLEHLINQLLEVSRLERLGIGVEVGGRGPRPPAPPLHDRRRGPPQGRPGGDVHRGPRRRRRPRPADGVGDDLREPRRQRRKIRRRGRARPRGWRSP